jgi:hypothetical protein
MDPHFFIFCAVYHYISKSGPGDCQSAGYSLRISAQQDAVAVELNLVEPFLAFWQLVDQPRIHRFDELDFGGRQHAEVFRFHEECERVVRGVQRLFDHFIHFRR